MTEIVLHGPPPQQIAFLLGALWRHVRPLSDDELNQAREITRQILLAVGVSEEDAGMSVLFCQPGMPLSGLR